MLSMEEGHVSPATLTADYHVEVDINRQPGKILLRHSVGELCANTNTEAVDRRAIHQAHSASPTRLKSAVRGEARVVPVNVDAVQNFHFAFPVLTSDGEIEPTRAQRWWQILKCNIFPYKRLVKICTEEQVLTRLQKLLLLRCNTRPELFHSDYGVNKYLGYEMTEYTFRHVIYKILTEFIERKMNCELVTVHAYNDGPKMTAVTAVSVSETGAEKMASRLGFYLPVSKSACAIAAQSKSRSKALHPTAVPEELVPSLPYSNSYEKTNNIFMSRLGHVFQRYDRLDRQVDVQTTNGDCHALGELSKFTTNKKLKLTIVILERYFDLDACLKVIHPSKGSIFGIHDEHRLNNSVNHFSTWKYFVYPFINADQIKSYFGEYVGLEFTFAQHVAQALIVPSSFSLILVALHYILDREFTSSNVFLFGCRLAALLVATSTLSVTSAMWRCVLDRSKLRWNMYNGEELQRALKRENPLYHFDTWTKDDRDPRQPLKQYDKTKALTRRGVSWILTFFIAALGVFVLSSEAHNLFWTWAGVLKPLEQVIDTVPLLSYVVSQNTLVTVTILFFEYLVKTASKQVTKIENHRYMSSRLKATTWRGFMVTGFRVLLPVLYVAFAERHVKPIIEGHVDDATDNWRADGGIKYAQASLRIQEQMRNLYVVSTIVGVVTDFIIPMWILPLIASHKYVVHKPTVQAERVRTTGTCATKANYDYRKPQYRDTVAEDLLRPVDEGTTKLYFLAVNELTLAGCLSVVWPEAPLFALLKLLLVIRLRSQKLTKLFRKALPRDFYEEGAWYQILRFMTFVTIPVASGLFVLTGDGGLGWFNEPEGRLKFLIVVVPFQFLVRFAVEGICKRVIRSDIMFQRRLSMQNEVRTLATVKIS